MPHSLSLSPPLSLCKNRTCCLLAVTYTQSKCSNNILPTLVHNSEFANRSIDWTQTERGFSQTIAIAEWGDRASEQVSERHANTLDVYNSLSLSILLIVATTVTCMVVPLFKQSKNEQMSECERMSTVCWPFARKVILREKKKSKKKKVPVNHLARRD